MVIMVVRVIRVITITVLLGLLRLLDSYVDISFLGATRYLVRVLTNVNFRRFADSTAQVFGSFPVMRDIRGIRDTTGIRNKRILGLIGL